MTHMKHGLIQGVAMLAILLGLTASGAPCTRYKEADIANARENVARYTWAQNIVASWKRRVAFVMEQDPAFFEKLVPELTPWTLYGNNCPVCVGKQSSMGEINLFRWNVKAPDTLTCKYCKTVFPNEKYPETGRLVCPKMGQTFSYYETEAERAHPEERSGKHAFRWASWPVHTSWSGYIRYQKANWVAAQVLPLAKLYALSGEALYAERCVLILDLLAARYPGWLYHTYNGTFADCPPAEAAAELGRHPRAGRFPKEVIVNPCGLHQYKDHAQLNVGFWGAGRLYTGSGEGSMLLNCTVAYDLIREARRGDGSLVLDKATERRVLDNLILAGCTDRANWDRIHNKAGPNRALSVAVGILFAQPEGVRRGLEGFEKLIDGCFHSDGFCRESPSYSSMHLSLMENIPLLLRGYSDPPGYADEKGER
ncbi:MAG: hypothetical protein KAI66_21150, partial [Lentisphaeria bacterium]|nr:hypothetical protein [Lentisphaeria bacterium]